MPPLVANLALWILDSALAAAAILALGRILLGVMVRPAARQRLIEWTLAACLGAALLPAIPGLPRLGLGLMPALPPPASAIGPGTTHFDFLPGDSPSGNPAPRTPHAAAPAAALPAGAPGWSLPRLSWCAWLLVIYFSGAALVALRLLIGYRLLANLARAAGAPDAAAQALWARIARQWAMPGAAGPICRAQLLITRHLARPVTFGLRTPVILIPTALCAKPARRQLVAVLRHEAVHVARRDAWSWTLAALVQTLFFYQPLFWMMRRDLRVAQELIADASAAARFPSPAAYARQLLHLLRQTNTLSQRLLAAPGAVGRQPEFFLRMRRLLERSTPLELTCPGWFSWATGAALLALTVAATSFSFGSAAAHHTATTAAAQAPAARDATLAEQRGLAFLASRQDAGGAWLPRSGPAMTALVAKALLQAGQSSADPAVHRALAFIDRTAQPDHGFYLDSNPTYNTAIVLSTLALLPDNTYRERIAAGRQFLQSAAAPAAASPTNSWYAPDQSNDGSAAPAIPLAYTVGDPADAAGWTIEALHAAGTPPGDPLLRQSLQHAAAPFNPDPNERAAGAVLPNYGSLTYAGLKSMLYAGLTRDDPRVQLAVRWIRQNYTLDSNPADAAGRGQFYYYHTFAKALRTYGESPFTDSRGVRHDWRAELRARLTALQSPDGSWVNQKTGDYLENDPVVVTTYSVLALQEARR